MSADTAEATVESLNHDARGVARVAGKVTFIDGALPGETVRFRYVNKHDRFDSGIVTEIVQPSMERVEPRCPHFGICGGCALQHLDPGAQLAAKQQVLADSLTHIGKLQPAGWLPPLIGPVWGYRRRARVGARMVPKKGGLLLGFRERRRSFITPLHTCPVLPPTISALLPALRDCLERLSHPDRVPQIELAEGDNATALVIRHLVSLTAEDKARLAEFGVRHDLQIWLQPGAPNTASPLTPSEPQPLYYRLPEFDVVIQFAPTEFVQVNHEVNRVMVSQALALLDPQPHETVLDLFCGLGNFSLPLARRAARVLGLEVDAQAAARARDNAEHNAIFNAEFRVANLYDEASAVAPWAEFRCDKLLLDPPRTGALEAIKRLTTPLPGRIVYVSCNPATLARDAAYLVHVLGYRLASAGVLDMFPHTSHVESMALFVQS